MQIQVIKNSLNTKSIIATSDTFDSEWNKKMLDYDSDYVYIIPLKYKTKELYYENITRIPSRFRGAFIIDEESIQSKAEFEILDPDNQRVFINTSQQCFFDLNVTKVGRYSLIFNNKFVKNDLKVIFTMSTGQNIILKKEDITLTEQKLETLHSFIKKFDIEFKINRNLHQEKYKSKL